MTTRVLDDKGRRMLLGWLTFAVIAILLTTFYYFLPYLAGFAAVVHIVLILSDAGMNGMRDAEWVPFNLMGLSCALIGSWLAVG